MRPFDVYERFLGFASKSFIVRAVFPWIFVLFVDVAVYETLIHDGRSLIGLLSGLQENFQAYTAVAIAAVVAGLALISDNIVNLLVSSYRSRAWKEEQAAPEPDQFPFEVQLWQRKTVAEANAKDFEAPILFEIDRVHMSTHRSANLAIGFGVSIWVMVYELARYQESPIASVFVIVAMGTLVIGSIYSAERDVAILTVLDRIYRSKDAYPKKLISREKREGEISGNLI
jgi:hypothetical protein